MNDTQLEQIKTVLDDLKAEDIKSFSSKDENGLSEELIIATARSTAHMRSTANNVKIEAKRIGLQVIGYEGLDTGWAIIDMAFVVVHVMTKESREFYNLDKLFADESEEVELDEISD